VVEEVAERDADTACAEITAPGEDAEYPVPS
jgi:hypothetical protein